jgi:two-component system LytT family sensor kinase
MVVLMDAPFRPLPASMQHPPIRRTRGYWICQLLGWGSVVVGLSIGGIANDPGLYRQIWVLDWTALGVSGLIASHLLRRLVSFQPIELIGPRLIIWVGSRMILAMGAMWVLRALLVKLIEPAPYNVPQWSNPVYGAEIVVVLAAWTAVYFAFDYYRRYQDGLRKQLEMETALKESQLNLLRSQLNPHFLFNSLNTLLALIPVELELPRQGVTMLSELLRASLGSDQATKIPLAEELRLTENYIALQRLRFEGRLQISWSISAETSSCWLPPFIIQGLLENAVKHGISRSEAGGEIEVKVWLEGKILRISVANPGEFSPKPGTSQTGLMNTAKRLELLYGPSATLRLKQAAPSRVLAELAIPQSSRRDSS